MDIKVIASNALSGFLSEFDNSIQIGEQELIDLLEIPKHANLGDVALPCFFLAKALKRAPQQISADLAEKFSTYIEENSLQEISGVKAEGPYVNLFLNAGFIASLVFKGISDGELFLSKQSVSETVMVEYSQPNTHKAFHVGHVRNAVLGDSLSRMLTWDKQKVIPVNYIGDEGTHVAKCLWYLENHFEGEIPENNLGEFLGLIYVKATDLLDFSTLTEAPVKGVLTCRVESSEPLAGDKKGCRTTVTTNNGSKVLISPCPLSKGQIVPYALNGQRLPGKVVSTRDFKESDIDGIVCLSSDIGMSAKSESVPEIKADTAIGIEVADVFALDKTTGRSVIDILSEREREVGEVLQGIENKDPELYALWEKTKKWSMDEFHAIYKWLDCKFDHYFYESEFGESSKELVREYLKKGVFVEDEGAIGANLNDYNLGFCILIKRNGTALYATRDLTLALEKFDTFGVDRSLYIVDASQTYHFQQVFKCLELMGYDQVKQARHIAYGQVVRPDGKMSSRKGNVILFSELKSLLMTTIIDTYLSKYQGDWSQAEIDHAAYVISLATIRYGMLKQENNSQITFDLEEWSAQTGNTGPYILYAYARIASLLKENGYKGLVESTQNSHLLTEESEKEVILHIAAMPQAVASAVSQLSPHIVCAQLFDLAKKFNRMYAECPIKSLNDKELAEARLHLVSSVGESLKFGLSLLGIPVLERM